MKIKCLHGYFFFEEKRTGDIARFCSLFGFDLALQDWYYTFTDLIDAPEYSIEGGKYLAAAAGVTFAGRPWEIMRQNDLVYDFVQGKVVALASVKRVAEITGILNSYLSSGMIVPGSTTDGGKRITDYAASFSFDLMRFKYSEITVDEGN